MSFPKYPKYKDSGVQWLGEVPAHWEIQRIKNVSPHITVGIVVEPSRYYVEEGVPALRSLNVRPGGIVKENMVMISDTANEEQQKSRLRAGDLVAVRTGQPGTTAVVPTELDNCNCIDLIIIRKPTNGFASFLCWFLNSSPAQRQFSAGSGGAIQQHFNVELAKSLVITWPPEDEQIMISDHLSKITNEFDLLIDEGRTAITLLQERRTALISAAVTGQIDVRGLAGASNAPESIAANAYP